MKSHGISSARITLILCFILAFLMLLLTASLPWVWKWLILFFDSDAFGYVPTLCIMYAACLFGIAASVMLIFLMKRVLSELIFTEKSVSLIRAISLCCFCVTPLFLAIGFWYTSFFVIAFATAFLGLMLRVVKNVIEQASLIKSENDLTV